MESIKDGVTKRINHARREAGKLFQPPFLIALCARYGNITKRWSTFT